MRLAPSTFCVGVVTVSRTYRAVAAVMRCVVTRSALPATVTAVVQAAPSALVSMVKARVLYPACSPPAAACRTTNRRSVRAAPRSSCRVAPATPLHHLLLPVTTPSAALAGDSASTQAAEPVTAVPRARFAPGYAPDS